MNITLYFILFVILTVPLRAGDTLQHMMDFSQVFKNFPLRTADYTVNMEGTIVVDVRIDTGGRIGDIHFIRSAGDIVDSLFAVALCRIKGRPRKIDGKAVDTWVRQTLILWSEYGGKGLDSYENSFANYTKALENDTTNSAARFYGRGRVHYQFGDMEAARTDFVTARNLGCMHPWYEDFQLDLVRPWLPSDTAKFDSLLHRAELFRQYGLFERARGLYMRLSRMEPNAIGPLRGLMLLYGDRRDYENAASIATVLLQRGDLTADDLRACSWWLYSAGRYDRAVAAGDAGLSLNLGMSSRSYIAANYAISLLSQGQLGAARAAYKTILQSHYEYAVGDLKRHIRLGRPNAMFAREILVDIFHVDRDEIP